MAQLTQEQRYQIKAYLETGMYQKDIATKIGVHASTISKELKKYSSARISTQTSTRKSQKKAEKRG